MAVQKPIKYKTRLELLTSWYENNLTSVETGSGSTKMYMGWSPQNIRGIISYISDSMETSGVILLRHLNLDNSPKVIKLSYNELLRAYKKNNAEYCKNYDVRIKEETGRDEKGNPVPVDSIFKFSSLVFTKTTTPVEPVLKGIEQLKGTNSKLSVEVQPGRYIEAKVDNSNRVYKGIEEFVVLTDTACAYKSWYAADKDYVACLQFVVDGINKVVTKHNTENPDNKFKGSLLVWNRLYAAGYFELYCQTTKVPYKLQDSDRYGQRFTMIMDMCKESTKDHVGYQHFCDLLKDKNIALRTHKTSGESITPVFGGAGHECIRPLFINSWYKYVPGTLTPKNYIQDSIDGTENSVLLKRFQAIEEHYNAKNAVAEQKGALERTIKQLSADIKRGMCNLEYPVRFWPNWLEMLSMTYFNIQMLAGNMCQLELLRGYSSESAYTSIKNTKLMEVMREIMLNKSSTMERTEKLYKGMLALKANKEGSTPHNIMTVHRTIANKDIGYLAVKEIPEDYKPSLERAVQLLYYACVCDDTNIKLLNGEGTDSLIPMFEEFLAVLYFIIKRGTMRDIKYKFTMIEDNIDKTEERIVAYNMFKIMCADKLNGFGAIKPLSDIVVGVQNGSAMLTKVLENSYGCLGDIADMKSILANIHVGTCTNSVGMDYDSFISAYKQLYFKGNSAKELKDIVGSPWTTIKNEKDVACAKADIMYLSAFIESRIRRQYAISMLEWLNYMDIMYNEKGTMRLDLLTADIYEAIARNVAEKGFPTIVLCKKEIFAELRTIFTQEVWDTMRDKVSEEIDRIWQKIATLFATGYFGSRLCKIDSFEDFKFEGNGDVLVGVNCKDMIGVLYSNGFLLGNLVTQGLRVSNVRSSVYKNI